MVITKLQGGLGNQMFQYALGRKLSLGLGTELLLDLSAYGRDAKRGDGRPYSLNHFNIAGKVATEKEIHDVGYPHGVFMKKIKDAFDRTFLRHNHIKFEPSVLAKKGDVYLDGFWQSEKYFKDIRQTLLGDFSLKEPLSAQAAAIAESIKKESESISMHVRRGDYALKGNVRTYGNQCGPEYYAKALKTVARDLCNPHGQKTPHIFIFSDDIEWVREHIDIPYQKTYIPTSVADYEGIALMSLCRAHIIANSTYGWWGAWLDPNNAKIVAAPSAWTPGIDLPIDDILPGEWVRVDSK